MGRIHFPTPDDMSPEQRQVFDKIVSGPRGTLVGPLRAALHNPVLADRWQQLGQVLRFETSLPPALNELAILLTARRWNSVLEWAIHERDATREGLDATWIDAIRIGKIPDFGAQDAAAEIYDYVCQLLNLGTTDQPAYDAVRLRWHEVGVVELTAVVGYYSMVAMTLNTHQIPLPDSVVADLPVSGEGLFELPIRR